MANQPLQVPINQEHAKAVDAARGAGALSAVARLTNALDAEERKSSALEQALHQALERAERAEAELKARSGTEIQP